MTEVRDVPVAQPPTGSHVDRWYAGPVPERHHAGDLLFVRLTAAHAGLDHEALMSSLDYLRMWSDSEWPTADFSVADNEADLAWHDAEHEARIAFTYSVQDPDGSRVLGCLYLRPLRDMLLTRGVEPPAGPSWPGGDTPCVHGVVDWVLRAP